jgi:plastocyanin
MNFPRVLLLLVALVAVGSVVAACGGDDDSPSDEEYFQTMDEVDKEVDAEFNDIDCDENSTAQDCAASFGQGLDFAETKYTAITASADAADEHEELTSAITELNDNVGSAEFEEGDGADVFFENVWDTERVDAAFCAIQDLADEKSIEADVGCTSAEAGPDPATLEPVETTDVLMEGFAFDPPHIQVTAGDTVTWTQGADPEPHNAAADDGSFAFDPIPDEGVTGEATFDEAGVFPYACEVHPEMRGQVTVVE